MLPRSAVLYSISLVASLLCASFAYAAEEDPYADNLFGNWGGIRNKMSAKGVDMTLEYKADFWSIADGGAKTGGNYMDNLMIGFDLDGEKLFGIKGNKAVVSFFNAAGGKPNSQAGSLQGIDNYETDVNTFKLYEAWMEQSFMDDRLSVLLGVQDLNGEFYINDASANFMIPSFQLGQEITQSGLNSISAFPTTALGARLRFNPTEASYVMAGVYDGVPGDPNDPHGTHIDLRKRDGLFLIAEAGWTPKVADQPDATPNKLAVGAWSYTKSFPDLVTAENERSDGVYMTSSYRFYHDASNRNLSAFFQTGWADDATVQTDWAYETGLVGSGWVKARPDAEIGFGVSQAHNGDNYMLSVSGAADRSETSFELYYRDKLCKGVTLQPVVQYVVNPGTDPAIDNATIFGLRADINF